MFFSKLPNFFKRKLCFSLNFYICLHFPFARTLFKKIRVFPVRGVPVWGCSGLGVFLFGVFLFGGVRGCSGVPLHIYSESAHSHTHPQRPARRGVDNMIVSIFRFQKSGGRKKKGDIYAKNKQDFYTKSPAPKSYKQIINTIGLLPFHPANRTNR